MITGYTSYITAKLSPGENNNKEKHPALHAGIRRKLPAEYVMIYSGE